MTYTEEIDATAEAHARMIARLDPHTKEVLLQALLMKRHVDGLNGRTWHASLHLSTEQLVAEIIKDHS